ncbi:MAG TPA: alpha/beta hydrolase [Polaromonas sp.]|uniref:alpha/beta fold hydrolase n=1 Tax=Polaromonas sp. UBA4122 TaxID=1947074 RepID=UPI000EEEA824|nr:alpha/beta fold hydrolase [Polaromonas sp. UBA4122]HAL40541.1 alpha/beta hydrolase [Polaromonas sp.]
MKKPVLHWIKEGQGPLVVLSHALGCDLGMWDGVAAILKNRYTVLRYDHRGHGCSEAPPGPYTIEMLADDAANLISAQTDGTVHFVGLSMGGMVAQALAARYPQLLKSIVIANAASWYDDAARALWQARVQTVLAQGVAAIADGAMQRWFTPEFRADETAGGAARVAALRQQLEKTDAAAYAASCEAVAGIDFRSSNSRILCPALVIAGTRDEATPVPMSQAICNSIAGAQLRTLAAAHLSAVEQPEAFVRLIDTFYTELT